MKKEKHLAFERGIEDTRNKFQEWRRKRKNRREPIPTDLLDMAAGKCRQFPYTKVAKALQLNPTTLKNRLSGSLPQRIKKIKGRLDFVEMKIKQQPFDFMGQPPACEISIHSGKGDSIKIAFAEMPANSFIFQVLNKTIKNSR